MCAEASDIMGTVLSTARANGWLNNTIVVYTSDHGEMSMEVRASPCYCCSAVMIIDQEEYRVLALLSCCYD
jgi:arylsulfatase A-like enzyme